ncbi:type VI secretion system-associated protein TagF [Roseospira goensis]|uniref:Type VI secretion system protein ImpM n=1 Tax=Roseospira goensis TaxID=391922 RepID=A0A7W6WL23_9PROT|nr:type VI secretion system-associated protein TagF [Roseospira goensis]MBB4286258.1 type VI secretion system protein ImpM [Roseospira goensis]
MMAETGGGIGFFGKLPAHGDFVRRGLDHAVAAAWDGWLGALMMALREDLGEDDWLDAYLTGPVWRFATGGGLAGLDGVARTGVLVPSVDRVGRYFPLVIAAAAEGCESLAAAARDGTALLDALEALALRALDEDDELEADALQAALDDLAWDWPTSGRGADAAGVWVPLGGAQPGDAVGAVCHLLDGAGRLSPGGADGLWWTDGSERVEPGVLRVHGWPRPTAAVALFDGAWGARGWLGPDPDRG